MSLNRLKRWRLNLQITQEEAAKKLKVSQPTYYRWENDKVAYDRCHDVAKVTGIPVHLLRPDIFKRETAQ